MNQQLVTIWIKTKKCPTASNGLIKNKICQAKVTDLWATDIMNKGRMIYRIDLDS